MTPAMRVWLGIVAVVAVLPVAADAHFTLVEPASWLMENRLGDPQKAGPCGGTSADAGTPTMTVTPVAGGSKLHIKVQETVFHPGHYRIALAVRSRAELPPDPDVATRDTEKGPWSVSAAIQKPERPPVIADGLWAHTERPAGHRGWPVAAHRAAHGPVRDRYRRPQHQLREVHAADHPVHGRARPQPRRRFLVSPLRGPEDHGGPQQAAGRPLARGRRQIGGEAREGRESGEGRQWSGGFGD